MLQTALRWMGARWWAAAAMAATVIILFRTTEVGAPSSVMPHESGSRLAGAEPRSHGASPVEASFRKAAGATPSKVRFPGLGAAESRSSDVEFLELRKEIAELKGALRGERERAALYSQSYEDVTRQYDEISRLASLLMEEAQHETEHEIGHEPERKSAGPVRTPEQRALVERALGLMELRAHGLRVQAAYSASKQVAPGKATPGGAVPQSASATLGGAKAPMPTEAIFIQSAPVGSEPKQ